MFSISAHGADKAAARTAVQAQFRERVMAQLPAFNEDAEDGDAAEREGYEQANMARVDAALDALGDEPLRVDEVVHVHLTDEGCSAKNGPL